MRGMRSTPEWPAPTPITSCRNTGSSTMAPNIAMATMKLVRLARLMTELTKSRGGRIGSAARSSCTMKPPMSGGAAAQYERGNPQGQIDPEHPAPGEIVDEEAAEDRAAHARGCPHAAQVALVTAALARGNDVGDDRLRHADEAAPAQPLQRPGGDELRHVLGDTAQHRRGDENDDGDLQQGAAAIEIAQFAIDRRRRGRGQEICGDDPRQVLEAVELAGDRGQRRSDDALIERRQHHAEQDAAEDDENLTMGEGLAVR